MPLLPEEFPAPQEGAGGLFPAEHAAPLVIQAGQIPPGMDDMAPMVAEQRLRGGADAKPLGQLLAAAHGDPRALRREALHMVLLPLQQTLRNEQGHGHVAVAGGLKLGVQHAHDVLPDGVAVGAQDEAALHAGIIHQLRLGAHVGEPLGKIHLHIGDLFDFLFFGHLLYFLSDAGPSRAMLNDHFIKQSIHCQAQGRRCRYIMW